MKHICNGDLRLKNSGETVNLYGFVANKRHMGGLVFVDLRDASGIVQLVLNRHFNSFHKESIIEVTGQVVERKQQNPQLPTGAIEISVTKLTVLSQAAPELPFVIRDDLEAKEETRLKHRYLDLRRPKMHNIIKNRHIIFKTIRDFLDAKGFYEIETPLLTKPTPEGARDFLVATRRPNAHFALPQSPQLYKQLLIASGFEKYFQIARVFRDEDSRKDRQPEFTQLDLELAYGDEETLKALIEALFKMVFDKMGLKISLPFPRMDHQYALAHYGVDKPDTRFQYLLRDVTSMFVATDFRVFKNQEVVKMIAFDQVLSNEHIRLLTEVARKNSAKGLAYCTLEASALKGSLPRFLDKEIQKLFASEKIKSGTLLFGAGKKLIVNRVLGAVRNKLNDLFQLASSSFNFVWIENWPLFEFDEQTNSYAPTNHPFTMPAPESLANFDIDRQGARARSYDLVLNGYELGSGSVRINKLRLQKRMFQALGLSEAEQTRKFGFFLEAFNYGLPPHLGIALGLDRLVMIMNNATSIRDVIAFPKNAHQIAVMEGAPITTKPNMLQKGQNNETKTTRNH